MYSWISCRDIESDDFHVVDEVSGCSSLSALAMNKSSRSLQFWTFLRMPRISFLFRVSFTRRLKWNFGMLSDEGWIGWLAIIKASSSFEVPFVISCQYARLRRHKGAIEHYFETWSKWDLTVCLSMSKCLASVIMYVSISYIVWT